MIVQLRRRHPKHRDLTAKKPYVVLGIEADDLRLINDYGQPYLYPSRLFDVISKRMPRNWIRQEGEDGEQYAYPPSLNTIGFFEDYHDDVPDVQATFWQTVNEQLASSQSA